MTKKTIIIIGVVVILVAGGIFAFINYEPYIEDVPYNEEEREAEERREVEEKVEETKEEFISLAEKVFALDREEVGAETMEEINEKFNDLDRGLTQLDEDYVRREVTSAEFLERMDVFLQEIKDLAAEVEEM